MSAGDPLESRPDDPAAVAAFARARQAVLDRIAAAAGRVGRDPAGVTLVAVSKTVPPERLRFAAAAGLDLLAENRVQEAEAKVPLVPGARWHLVGPLQSNKARRAVELFSAIQSLDSLELARRLDRIAGELRPAERLRVLLQVNVDSDPGKAGFDSTGIEAAIPELLELPHLEVAGLMTIGRLAPTPDAARPTFVGLRRLSERLRGGSPAIGTELSMGMTDDFEFAIEEGATIVRVGRALFGERHA